MLHSAKCHSDECLGRQSIRVNMSYLTFHSKAAHKEEHGLRMYVCTLFRRRHDIQHNDTLHNDPRQMIDIGIQHSKKCDTQNSDTEHNNKRDATENK
jgi:hypothetical protein